MEVTGEVEVVKPVLKVTSIASTMPIICSKSVDFRFRFPHTHDKAALEMVLRWKLFQCSYTTNVYRAGATTGIGLYSDTFPRELLPACSRFWALDWEYSVGLSALNISFHFNTWYFASFTPKYIMMNSKDLFETNCVRYLHTMEGKKKQNMLIMKPLTETVIYNKLR